jgi:hypothetical protein
MLLTAAAAGSCFSFDDLKGGGVEASFGQNLDFPGNLLRLPKPLSSFTSVMTYVEADHVVGFGIYQVPYTSWWT